MSRKTTEPEPVEEPRTEEDPAAEAGTPDSPEEPGRIEQLEAEAAEWRDRAQRLAAEMQNARKRSARDAEEAIQRANERFLLDLLPVLENFERAIDASNQHSDVDAVRAGVEAIHRLLCDAVERAGLSRIEAVGARFDPNLHEAILQVEAGEGEEENIVVEELRPGYKLHDRVLRPSLVKVTIA